MIIRAAGEHDFWGLFLLYAPRGELAFALEREKLTRMDMTRILDAFLSHPEYKFYVVEYKLEIVAAYGLRNEINSGCSSAPVISDIKIAEGVHNILAMDELVEHAILQGRLAGYSHISCTDPHNTLPRREICL